MYSAAFDDLIDFLEISTSEHNSCLMKSWNNALIQEGSKPISLNKRGESRRRGKEEQVGERELG